MRYLKKLSILWMILCMLLLSVNYVQPVQAAELKGSTRAEQLFNYFYEKGYSSQACAAIVASVMWESSGAYKENFSLHTVEKGTMEGIGICQWSFGRKANFIAYCKSKNVDWKKSTLKMQADFLDKELKSGKYWMFPSHVYSSALAPYKMSYAKFKTQKNIKDAVGGFLFNFLRPSEYYAHFQDRINYAQRLLKKYEKQLYAPTNYSASVTGNDIVLNWSTQFPAIKSKIQVYDVNCKLVHTHTTRNHSYKVKDLDKGVYFVRVGAMNQSNDIKYTSYRIAVIGKSDQQKNVMATNLKIEAIDYDTLQIKWDAAKRADHYVLYRSIDGGEFKPYKTLKTNSYTMENAKTGVKFAFKIKTWSKIDGTIQETPFTSSVSGKTKLDEDIQLEITRVNKTKFQLDWNVIAGATSYDVYMKTSIGSYQKIKTLKADVCKYTTSVLTPDTYSFKVRAARYSGNERVVGKLSNAVRGKSVFTKPNVQIEAISNNSIQLSWEKVDGVSYYCIYRKVSKEGVYQKLTSVSSTTYTDEKLENNQTYYYKVKGYRNVDGINYVTPLSTEVNYSF